MVYLLFLKDTGEVKVLDEASINTQDTVQESKVLYTVNNDFTELKNPFSFEHEKEKDTVLVVKEEEKPNIKNQVSNKVVNTQEKKSVNSKKEEKKTKSVKNKYELEAIFDINQQKTALLKIDGKDMRVKTGDKVNDMVVTEINKNSIVLQTTEGMSINCPLNSF
ncbi:MAG TPA: hypothetical protein K8V25_00795 [Megamonas hypermegale]|nr:hypothetical protein [Megamonas hypermegale]HJG06780.1 hypothetical protein [Megamonas hypermegale]